MKNTLKKLSLLTLTLSLTLVTVACGSTKHKPVEVQSDNKEPVAVEDYTSDLKEEKEIMDGQVYIQDNTVIAAMIIKEEVTDKKAQALAEQYAKDLKATYTDKKVNVQAVKGGENIASVELD